MICSAAAEKLVELLGAMASVALADDPAGCDVEGGKQRGDACSRDYGAPADPVAWQHGLATIQGLDLRLLIDAQHDGALGRGHVEADDIASLGDEIRAG
jgi:hypothetical protein